MLPTSGWAEFHVQTKVEWFVIEAEAKENRQNVTYRLEGFSQFDSDVEFCYWLKTHSDKCWRVRRHFRALCVNYYTEGWNAPIQIPCCYKKGEHNWSNSDRYDVWFTNPIDGYQWYGRLISGGHYGNSTFRARRTKVSTLFKHLFERARVSGHKLRIKKPSVRPTRPRRFFRLLDGRKTVRFAAHLDGAWHFGDSIAEIVTNRLLL